MEDQNDNETTGEDAPAETSAEGSLMRVLDSSSHDLLGEAGSLQATSKPAFEDVVEDHTTAGVQSDFASDFADPSLLYRGPTSASDEIQETHEDAETEGPVEDFPREPTEEGLQIIEAAPEELYEPEEEMAGPGLPEKSEGGKPVLCLMGEFSAGKSTLSNLLIQTAALPVNVTATQLPPVWISKGTEAPYRVGFDGRQFDLELENLEDVSVEDTAFIRIFHDAELLDHCDLIDMPGISDPNMDAEVWQRVIPHADAVIWCSHATQAWRQSEAAVWSMLPPALYANSFLLLTRMDKILSERDQMRVAKRVGRETAGLFKEIFPISLTRALAADGDAEKWSASGAEDFSNALHRLLAEIGVRKAEYDDANAATDPDAPSKFVMPSRIQPKKLLARRINSRTRSAPAPLPPF